MISARTSGRWIVDQQGVRVKLVCVNWAGAEVKAPWGPWRAVVGGIDMGIDRPLI